VNSGDLDCAEVSDRLIEIHNISPSNRPLLDRGAQLDRYLRALNVDKFSFEADE